jgi:hypothetical protein
MLNGGVARGVGDDAGAFGGWVEQVGPDEFAFGGELCGPFAELLEL